MPTRVVTIDRRWVVGSPSTPEEIESRRLAAKTGGLVRGRRIVTRVGDAESSVTYASTTAIQTAPDELDWSAWGDAGHDDTQEV